MGDPHKDGSWGERRRRSGLPLAAAAVIAVGGIGIAGVALAGPTTSTLPVITTKATTSTSTTTTRPTTTTAAPVSCSSFPPARISEDYYLNIPGITSAGTTSGLGASFDPISDWSLTGSTPSASSGTGAGAPIAVGPLHLSLPKSSDGVALFSAFASGRHLATVTITTTPCGGGATESLVLSDVMVSRFATSWTQGANGGLKDAIELTFVKLVITRSQLGSNLRTWTTPVSSSYDLSSGRAA